MRVKVGECAHLQLFAPRVSKIQALFSGFEGILTFLSLFFGKFLVTSLLLSACRSCCSTFACAPQSLASSS